MWHFFPKIDNSLSKSDNKRAFQMISARINRQETICRLYTDDDLRFAAKRVDPELLRRFFQMFPAKVLGRLDAARDN
jgi:hypothetical protein